MQAQLTANGGQRMPQMFRPEHLRNLSFFSAEEKVKYEAGLQSMWTIVETTSPESSEHLSAKQKIIEISRMIVSKIQNFQRQQAQAQAQQQRQQLQQMQQQNAMQAAAAAAAGLPTTQPQGGGVSDQMDSFTAGGGGIIGPGVDVSAQSARSPLSMPQQRGTPSQQILQHTRAMNLIVPPHILQTSGQAGAAQHLSEIRQRYVRAMTTIEATATKIKYLDAQIVQVAARGGANQDELTKIEKVKVQQTKLHQDALKVLEAMQKTQDALRRGPNSQPAAHPGASQFSIPMPTQMQPHGVRLPGPSASNDSAAQMQQAQAAMNEAMEAAKNNDNSHHHSRMPGAPGHPVADATTSVTAAMAVAAAPAVALSAAASGGGYGTGATGLELGSIGSSTIKSEPYPPSPSLNSAVALAANLQSAQSALQSQQQQLQPQPPPQAQQQVVQPVRDQTPIPLGVVRLSHSAALALANDRPAAAGQTGSQDQSPVGGATTANGTNSFMGASQTHPSQQPNHQPQPIAPAGQPSPPQQSVAQTPIPAPTQLQSQSHMHIQPYPQLQPQPPPQPPPPPKRYLQDKATALPQPVSIGGGVGPGRPSLTGGGGTLGGAMGQPVIHRTPAYVYASEGDHVLSKKKLDELVMQVCGAATTVGDGSEANTLTAEVEENVLNLADSYVDNVLHAACRIAKERGSKVLEIRDIQLVLERTYNIRVPGYSSDELRTVRRIQPAPGWVSKMGAIQAAKALPAKGE